MSSESSLTMNEVRTRVWFEVPVGVESFWGREDFLKKLHRKLQRSKTKIVPTILSQLKVVGGPGGIGKTQTVLKYICEYGNYYENVIWIQAETETTVKNSFLRLANKLQISTIDSQGKPEKINGIVEHVYEKLCIGVKSTLFVFDNADDFKSGVEQILPVSVDPALKNLGILVTSRNQEWSYQFESFKVLSLDVLSEDETQSFILKQLKIPDSSAIRDFIQLTGGLPLALQQSVAFIKEKRIQINPGYNFSDYLNEFKSALGKVLDYDKIPGSPLTVFVTWNVTFDKIRGLKNGEMTLKILEALAFLYPEKAPVILIQSIFPGLKDPEILSCLNLLQKYSLINRKFSENGEIFVGIHRQLQFVIMLNLNNSNRIESVFDNLLDQCHTVLKTVNVARNADILINIHQLVENPFNFIETTEKFLGFIQDFIEVLLHAGRFYESLNLCKKAYNSLVEILGENHENTLIMLQERATSLLELGKHDEALTLFQDVLARMEVHLGSEHPSTLATKHEMARVLFGQEKYSESSSLLEKLLEQKKGVLGNNHRSTLKTQGMLATVYSEQGKLTTALNLYEEIEKKEVELLGADHPDTLTTSHCKAVALLKLGRVKEATELFHQVYEKQKEVLGENHPDANTTREWISIVANDDEESS